MERETPIGLAVVLDGLDRMRQALEIERSLPQAAEILVTSAVEIVPSCDGAAVTEWGEDEARVLHATTPALAGLEESQIDLGTGPGRWVITGEPHLRSERGDPRWPEWSERAAEAGMVAAVAFRLFLPGPATTSLTLYGRRPEPAMHDASSEALGLLVATVGSIALSGVRRHDQLRQAIQSRDVIGQAKGILMHRWKLTAEGAFDVLRRASSDTNIPLRVVAERVVAEGDVPKQ